MHVLALKEKKNCKRTHFACCFHISNQGQPMIEYENTNDLFTILKFKHNHKKHWSILCLGWFDGYDFVCHCDGQNERGFKCCWVHFHICSHLTMATRWETMQMYLRIWKQMPILLTFENVITCATTTNLT